MTRLIADLLDYTHGHMGGGIPIARDEADMAEIGRRVVEELASTTGETIAFTTEGDTRGHWDPDRVAQVLTNLIGNALHHGSGEVTVTLQANPDCVRLCVGNDGEPIPSDLLARVTQPFAHGAGQGHGLGLGLYIVDEIVRAHGGTLRIASDTQTGTHVTITWPRTADQDRTVGENTRGA
jgi:signal transduction histidine kinase